MNKYNKWYELTEHQKRYLYLFEDSWIIVNLLKYGNCLIPNEKVKKYGEKNIENKLKEMADEEVVIDKKDLKKLGITYIARIKGW